MKRERVCGIYCWEVISGNARKIGQKYIGQSNNILRRKGSHISKLKRDGHENIKLQRYIKKYGIDSMKFFVLHHCPEKELNFWETFWVKCFDSYKNGFNLTLGGDDAIHATRKCTLQNIETGEIVTRNSIKEFCNEFNIKSHGMVSNVLCGKANFADVWMNPDGKWKPKIYSIKDPSGKIYSFPSVRLGKFCELHNLNKTIVLNVISGKGISHRGWTNEAGARERNDNSLEFAFVSPDGEIFKGKNVNRFAREHSLNGGMLREVLNEEIFQSKGWRKYKEGQPIKPFIAKSYHYEFISPNGERITCDNLSKFARENNLCAKNLQAVYSGKRKHHKGWTVAQGKVI